MEKCANARMREYVTATNYTSAPQRLCGKRTWVVRHRGALKKSGGVRGTASRLSYLG
jgi:hypothetical protein